MHVVQGMEKLGGDTPVPDYAPHPIELMARAWGLAEGGKA
jgi:hypothetical protein